MISLLYSTLMAVFLLMHIGLFSVLQQSCMCSVSQKAQVSCFHTVPKTLAMIQTKSNLKFGGRVKDILNVDGIVIMCTYIFLPEVVVK